MLNRCLSEAIFANKVLLVEGPSEYMLFSKVLSVVHPFYEVDGIYILPVDGVGFETYFSILDELEIFNVVKTDNDLRAVTGKGTYSVLGFSRCNNYIGEKRLPTKQIQENSVSAKRSLYNSNINTLDKIRSDFHIFLSKVDLENDLDEFLHDRLSALVDNDNPVKYLQDAKHYHMVELIEKLSDTDCRTIYNHYNFSTFYKVPDAYEKNRKMLNRCLSEAIFANKVLLVEGPSEYMLFSKVLSVVHPFYEVDGIYILPVDGVGFETYFSILDELEIFNVVKTDNDLRAVTGKGTYSVLGFSRCNNYIGEKRLPTKQIQENSVSAKRSLYNSNINTLDKIRSDFHIFLSKVDLENDLDEFLHDRLSALVDNDNPVKYLQDAKHYHMVELIEKLSDTDCRTIYNHYNFACLKEVAE